MSLPCFAEFIEFLLEEFIHSDVEIEAWHGWALRSEFVIEVEAAWTLYEEIYLRPREPPLLTLVVPFTASVRVVPFDVCAHV